MALLVYLDKVKTIWNPGMGWIIKSEAGIFLVPRPGDIEAGLRTMWQQFSCKTMQCSRSAAHARQGRQLSVSDF